jgi:phenylacetate-CoA ligase
MLLVDPPLNPRVEYRSDVEDREALKFEIEDVQREKLIVTVRAELVPPGALPRFEMKAQLVRKLYKRSC